MVLVTGMMAFPQIPPPLGFGLAGHHGQAFQAHPQVVVSQRHVASHTLAAAHPHAGSHTIAVVHPHHNAVHPHASAHPLAVAHHAGHGVAGVPHQLHGPTHLNHQQAVPAVVEHHSAHHVGHDGSVHSVHTQQVRVLPQQYTMTSFIHL